MKESDIQLLVCDYLAAKKYFFFRNNNTPVYDPVGKRFRAMPKFARKGVPDIILIGNGKNGIQAGQFIGLEIKTPKTYLSPDQKIFKEESEKAGAKYYTIKSFEDIQAIL